MNNHDLAIAGRTAALIKQIRNGVDANLRDDRGLSLLHCAAFRGHFETVRALIDEGADVNVSNHIGYTPLMVASREGYAAVVRGLLEKGAAVDAKTTTGWTALLFAAAYAPTPATTELLLEAGADPNIRDNKGTSALSHAKFRGIGLLGIDGLKFEYGQ